MYCPSCKQGVLTGSEYRRDVKGVMRTVHICTNEECGKIIPPLVYEKMPPQEKYEFPEEKEESKEAPKEEPKKEPQETKGKEEPDGNSK